MTPETLSPETRVILIGAALAAQKAAQAVTTATVGQTVTSFALVALVGLLAVVAILSIVAVIYFWFRARRAELMGRSGNWKSGPNALWGRDPQPQTPGIEMMLPMLMQQMAMMQAMMMSTFQHGTPPVVPQQESPTPLLLPDQYVVDDGDTNAPSNWGWGDWQV